MGADKGAELALKRAREISALCAQGLEELPASQKTRPMSDTQLALCALLRGAC